MTIQSVGPIPGGTRPAAPDARPAASGSLPAGDRFQAAGPADAAPAVDLRTAMRVMEQASKPAPADLEEIWSASAGHYSFRAMTSPTGNVVEVGNDRLLAVHGPKGEYLVSDHLPEGNWPPTPAFRPDGGFYVSYNDGIRSYSPEGQMLWERPARASDDLATGPDGRAYLDSPGTTQAFSPDGELLWSQSRTYPGRGEGIAVTPDGTLITVEGDDSVLARRPDGSEAWRYTGLRMGRYGPGAIPALLARPVAGPDGSVHLLNRQGELRQVGPDGQERWSVQVGANPNTSRDLAVDDQGNVFVMGGLQNRELFAFDRDGHPLFHEPNPGGTWLGAVPGGGVSVTGARGLVGYSPAGRALWAFSTDNQMPVSQPGWAPDGTMRTGGSQKVWALRVPAAVGADPLDRALATLRAEEPVPEVLQGEEWIAIGDVKLPVRGE